MSNKIFISYRRDDSHGVAGRLYDRLEMHFGRENIFMDVDTLEPGLDFVKEIKKAVDESDVFLAVIGPEWTSMKDANGNRRLDNPLDFVRLEVANALDRDVRVIPVLLDKTVMPLTKELPEELKPLARRNAIELSHARFNLDAERLIRAIEQAFGHPEQQPKPGNNPKVIKSMKESTSSTPKMPRMTSSNWSTVWATTGFWAVGGIIGGLIGGYIYGAAVGYIGGSYIFTGFIFPGAGIGLISNSVVGFVLGLILRKTELAKNYKQLFIPTLGLIASGILESINDDIVSSSQGIAIFFFAVPLIIAAVIFWTMNKGRS